jgi:hypothetical protein
MMDMIFNWKEMRVMETLYKNKLIFIETQDPVETGASLTNFRLVSLFLNVLF